MKVKIGGEDWNLALRCLSNEYNCSVKMVGRLSLKANKVSDPGKDLFVGAAIHTVAMENKKALIKEFSTWVVSAGAWTPLKDQNKMFPGDSGTYLPNMLLYADALHKRGYFYSSFPDLIAELQEDKSYGWEVFQFPMFTNNTYRGTLRPMRVWGLVPPSMVKDLLIADLVGKDVKALPIPETISAKDYREIRTAFGV